MFVLFDISVCSFCSPNLIRSVGLFHGSVIVNLRAKVFLQSKRVRFYSPVCLLKPTNRPSDMLKDSPFINELDHIIHCFDKTAKMRFKNKGGSQYIKFGSPRDNDAELNIRAGVIKLEGSANSFFHRRRRISMFFESPDLMLPIFSILL